MVKTRRQTQTESDEATTTNVATKRERSDDEANVQQSKKNKSGDKKTSGSAPRCKNSDNQPLIDALQDLLESVSDAQAADPKLRFQAANLRKVIATLASMDDKITSGKALSKGDDKVQGLGPKTADFIDDFLQHGKISAIDYYHDISEEYEHDPDRNHLLYINRAPVLTLWAVVVYEKQGYTHDEALTHARWISTIMARSKGKSLGKVDDSSTTGDGPRYEKTDNKVNAFGKIRVPIESEERGKRFAVMETSPLVPDDIDQYLQNAFGGALDRTQKTFERLADAVSSTEDLRDRAYDLYVKLRPEWQGWAQPGELDLDHVEELIQQERND